MGNECRFCKIKAGMQKYGIIDKPLFENKDFFVLSSIGSLVEGWLLVIPKEHRYNMSKDYGDKNFWGFIYSIIVKLKSKVGQEKNFLIFEHGANHCGSLTGCGTDHAHLHIVPYDKSLYGKIKNERNWQLCAINEIEDYVNGREYLLYAECDNDIKLSEVYINLVEHPESQFFRKIIAEDMGKKELFDYKTYPNIDISEMVCEMFGGK